MMSFRLGLRILGLAIALIAVQFVARPAQAHDGHAHAMHVHQNNSEPAADAAVAAQPVELRSADLSTGAGLTTCSGCVAGCCAGMGCSGAALDAAVPGHLPPPLRSSGLAPDRPMPVRGIDPESLRKPPRRFV